MCGLCEQDLSADFIDWTSIVLYSGAAPAVLVYITAQLVGQSPSAAPACSVCQMAYIHGFSSFDVGFKKRGGPAD